jgi:hypothetical protein
LPPRRMLIFAAELNVSSEESADRAVQQVLGAAGRLDIIIQDHFHRRRHEDCGSARSIWCWTRLIPSPHPVRLRISTGHDSIADGASLCVSPLRYFVRIGCRKFLTGHSAGFPYRMDAASSNSRRGFLGNSLSGSP